MVSDDPVPDWKLLIQPEGQPYFRNASERLMFRYLTEANLFEDHVRKEINRFVWEFETRARKHKAIMPRFSSQIEVVLQVTKELWLYYMVDVEHRCIFWMDECEFDSVLPPDFGIGRVEHLRGFMPAVIYGSLTIGC